MSVVNLQPGKMKAEERWKPQEAAPWVREEKIPKLKRREISSVFNKGVLEGQSSYKIPPGTTRRQKAQ